LRGRKTLFVDEEDEQEFDSELTKTLAAITEDYIAEGYTLSKEDDSKSEGGGEDEVLARYAATMVPILPFILCYIYTNQG